MKQLQLGQLNLGRLRYLLSGLAGSHTDLSENRVRSDRPVAERARCIPARLGLQRRFSGPPSGDGQRDIIELS